MHTNEPREDPLVEMGYEIRDVDYPKVRKAVYIFFAFGIGSALIGLLLYRYRFFFFALPQPADVTINRTLPTGNNPLLQGNVSSKTDIAVLRKQESERLTGTGYMDDSHTTAHIPVDRAMGILIQRGLPKTTRAVAAPTRTNRVSPGLNNLGDGMVPISPNLMPPVTGTTGSARTSPNGASPKTNPPSTNVTTSGGTTAL